MESAPRKIDIQNLLTPIRADEIEWQNSKWKIYGSYWVCADGTVFSTYTKRYVSRIGKRGYISFFNRDTKKDEKVHRVVASLYVANPNGYTQVNHIDGNKTNNRSENLEWCDQSYNIQHAYNTGLMKKGHDEPVYNSKRIQAFKGSESVGEYISTSECARKLGLSQGNISMVIKGDRAHTKGYTFKFI